MLVKRRRCTRIVLKNFFTIYSFYLLRFAVIRFCWISISFQLCFNAHIVEILSINWLICLLLWNKRCFISMSCLFSVFYFWHILEHLDCWYCRGLVHICVAWFDYFFNHNVCMLFSLRLCIFNLWWCRFFLIWNWSSCQLLRRPRLGHPELLCLMHPSCFHIFRLNFLLD